jgi:hypothetical protein
MSSCFVEDFDKVLLDLVGHRLNFRKRRTLLGHAENLERSYAESGSRSGHGLLHHRTMAMRSGSIWIGIFIGSTIGGLLPALWGGSMFSYTSVLLSGVGALVGLWIGARGL